MPHFTIEYSSNLESKVDFDGLCRCLLKAALATGVFEAGAIRVRALRCDHFAIADDHPENGFIDLSLRLASGRSLEVRSQIGQKVFAATSEFLAPVLSTPYFALSFEVREIDPKLSFKKNAIHDRLRA
jgi:5-carboxymethyl-2-hydroxymuconate isomerase